MKLRIALAALVVFAMGLTNLHAEENTSAELFSVQDLEVEIDDFGLSDELISLDEELLAFGEGDLLPEARRRGAPRPPRRVRPRPPRRVHPRPPRRPVPPRRRPRPPRRGTPMYTCYAENARGYLFSARGYWPRNVQNRAMNQCYDYSRFCYELGCN